MTQRSLPHTTVTVLYTSVYGDKLTVETDEDGALVFRWDDDDDLGPSEPLRVPPEALRRLSAFIRDRLGEEP